MTIPFILRKWGPAPEVPPNIEATLDMTVRDLIAIMQAQDATYYTVVDSQAEFTMALCVGSDFGRMAETVQNLFEVRPAKPAKTRK